MGLQHGWIPVPQLDQASPPVLGWFLVPLLFSRRTWWCPHVTWDLFWDHPSSRVTPPYSASMVSLHMADPTGPVPTSGPAASPALSAVPLGLDWTWWAVSMSSRWRPLGPALPSITFKSTFL